MDKDSGRPGGLSSQATEPVPVSALRASIPDAELWPVYEFRPLPQHARGTVLRYAEGEWLPDDGEWDIAFVNYGAGVPRGLGVDLPYQRNIIWSGLTSHWSARHVDHPRLNPWHYMLRDGETEWGGPWGRDTHPNKRAYEKAMSHCCSINRCANGSGPEFKIGDPYIAAGLLRERDTKRVATFPERLICMFCGSRWEHAAQAIEARRAETGTGSVEDESAVGNADAPKDKPNG